MADTTLQADSVRANAPREIGRLAEEMRAALERIRSLAEAIDDVADVLGNASEDRCELQSAAYRRVFHYRELIEYLAQRAAGNGDEIERLCCQLKQPERGDEPRDERAASVAATRERWGIRHG